MSETILRRATTADAGRIRELCGQLGYDTSVEKVRERIGKTIAATDTAVFIAEEKSVVQGWIQVTIRSAIESGEFVEITGLVVNESSRGQGIGASLVRRAEIWAAESGHSAIRVRTNILRTGTHDFYRKLGFNEMKRQTVFLKEL